MAVQSKASIISPILLRFRDTEVQKAYNNSKKVFFKRASPILAFIVLATSIIIELLQRLTERPS